MKKYEEIYHDIKNKIVQEEYHANEQLPFEKHLCATYQTSKMTVKRALDILVEDGLIIKRRGSGTFVKDLSKKEILRLAEYNPLTGLTSFFNSTDVDNSIISFKLLSVESSIAEKLNLQDGEKVHEIYRIRSINDKPIVIELTYIPIKLVPDLEEEHARHSIYAYLNGELHLTIQSAHRRVTIKKATEEESNLLNIPVGDPLGVTEQMSYLDTGETLSYSVTKHPYENFVSESVITK